MRSTLFLRMILLGAVLHLAAHPAWSETPPVSENREQRPADFNHEEFQEALKSRALAEPPSESAIAVYIDSLLSKGRFDEARTQMARLEKVNPGGKVIAELKTYIGSI